MKILSVPNYSFKVGIKNKNTQISVNNRTNFGGLSKEVAYLQKQGFSPDEIKDINEVMKCIVAIKPFELLKKIVNFGRTDEDKKANIKPFKSKQIIAWYQLLAQDDDKQVDYTLNVVRRAFIKNN